MIGIVTRFVAHKGIQLVQQTFHEMLQMGCRFVILGSGERLYEDFFREMQAEYPEQVHVTVGFVPAMARRIYAGADIFLMPSQNEPCGLAQMVAMRYGTIPVVRETGGLKDSSLMPAAKTATASRSRPTTPMICWMPSSVPAPCSGTSGSGTLWYAMP